ncbi:MFS transporter [Massilia yuzhufengensis]|uniref:Predicted arabinose efflux permease, MFS family n=1 Tax=Massilia yuzhufengensis TaxID=1164594 RepID=A0A1I1PZC0_9BURK|nr:MFS transporter [Massilia yuzhufengensis]SFD11260.1 Predicted arabinose efflux permease, MFS family [Massilia yuzhufengensis]
MQHRLLIATACLLALLSTTGASLAYPLLPPLFAGAGNALNSFLGLPPKLLFGIALMANPAGMLIGSAVLGSWSDSLGRRRMLLLTTVGAAAGHLLTAWALLAQSFPLLVAARFATGVLEGNGAILRALLAERLGGALRKHALSWINGAFHLGWLVGPLLSGLSAGHSITLPFCLAAAGLVLGALLSLLVLPPDPAPAGTLDPWRLARERHAFTLLRHGPLRTLFLIYFAYACGVAGFYEFFPLWLVEVGGYDAAGIALVNMAMCGVMTATAMVAGRAHPGDARYRASCQAGAVALAILCVGLGNLWIGMAAIMLFGLPHAFYNATLQAWASEHFAGHGQGAVMGLISTTFCLAQLAMALGGGLLALVDTRLVLVAGGLLAGWGAVSMRRWSRQSTATQTEFA